MIKTRCKCQLGSCTAWVVLRTRSRDNANQGYLQQHSSKRHKIAVIGGGVAGFVLLLLLVSIASLLFRRRRPQKHSLYPKFSVRRTSNLPMQRPPVRKMKISSPIPVEEDSSDLESIIAPYTIPLGPNESPFMDDAHPKLPWLPETCVTRDACNGRSGEFQVEIKAVRWFLCKLDSCERFDNRRLLLMISGQGRPFADCARLR
jgi:hypothetical protein